MEMRAKGQVPEPAFVRKARLAIDAARQACDRSRRALDRSEAILQHSFAILNEAGGRIREEPAQP